ncbi:MAG TPA: hypothetical protein VKZ53_18995 [Candidatus Angelobacter sp.]|nr:hypothetical protein [Candidatus Angelobacter sp.]
MKAVEPTATVPSINQNITTTVHLEEIATTNAVGEEGPIPGTIFDAGNGPFGSF